jgi:hypothetical protein
MADRTFAAATASAPRQKQYEQVDDEWRPIVAAMVEDRARRRRRHEVGTALLACVFAAVLVAVVVVRLG